MAEVNTFRCDGPGCDKVKGDSNHWFRAVKAPDAFFVTMWDHVTLTNDIRDRVVGAEEKHFCSENCASKAMSNAIGAKTPR